MSQIVKVTSVGDTLPYQFPFKADPFMTDLFTKDHVHNTQRLLWVCYERCVYEQVSVLKGHHHITWGMWES